MQGRAIGALTEGGFSGEALIAMAEYADAFGRQSPWWEGRQAADHPQVRKQLKDALDTLAAHHHAAFQAGDGSALEAAEWYRRWLEEFPGAPEAPERHFLLGELLYEDGRLVAAAEAYHSAAFAYGNHARAAEAGFAAIVARRDLVESENEDGSMDSRSAARSELIDAQLAFADAFGSDPRAPAVRVEAARRLLDMGRLEDAALQADRALADGRADPADAAAALLVSGHAAFGLGAYPVAEGRYAEWLTSPGDSSLEGAVTERLAAAIYRQGEAAEAAGDPVQAVVHYRRVADAVPTSPLAASGRHDAAALLFRQGDWTAAAAAYEDFLGAWPGHPLAPGARISLAEALVNAGDPGRAAPAWSAVSRLPGEDVALRRTAAWRAAELYVEAGLMADAEAGLEDYLRRFAEPADAAFEARSRLAELAGRRQDLERRQHWLREIITAQAAAGPAASARSTTLAAEAAMELARPAVEAFATAELALPLEQTVPAKVSTMEAAVAALGAAARYNVAEVTTEATFRMGELYRGMGSALMQSARPAGLDAETLEQYELLLEEQAFPFEEKAIDIHEANAARAAEGLYDEWIVKSFDALSRLVPARWDRRETGERLVRLSD
ncbi:MAG: tetratricopeptide repeat protein [Gammaproteobacteria bacterium]